MQKECKFCGKQFKKNINTSVKNWNERVKYCSAECKHKSKVGKPTWNAGTKGVMKPNSTSFKKGHALGKRFKKGHTPHNNGTATIYKHNCKQCKKEFEVSTNRYSHKSAKNKKFCSHKCALEYNKGEKSGGWKGGKTKLRDLIRKGGKYVKWRLQLFIENKYTCESCGQVGGKIEVHHIKAFSQIVKENNIKTVEQAISCDELWDKNNTQCLCKACHRKTDNYCSKAYVKIYTN